MSYTRDAAGVMTPNPPKLLNQVLGRLRLSPLQPAYRERVCGLDPPLHPGQRQTASGPDGAGRGGGFLTNLAARGQVSAGMQNQALAAPLFLYCEVLGVKMPMPSPAGSIHSPPRVALWIRGVAALAVIPSRKKCCSVR